MRSGFARMAIVFEGSLLLLAWALGWLLQSPPFGRLELSWTGLAWGVAATLPPLAGMWLCSRASYAPFRNLMRDIEEKLVPAFADCRYGELALVSAVAGLGEEALFRGALQGGLAEWLPPWAALSAASVMFGLGHLITPVYALLAAVIGFYLGALFLATDNLLVAVVAHGLYDFVALVYLIHRRGERSARRAAAP